MSDEEEECNCPPEGLPAYMGTFADLMSLLMCFFVLLLAFSEMDVQKFKQLAGSMKNAFGVQNKVEVKDIPKGTSVIAQEFSPGKPQPTPVEAVMQHTQEVTEEVLEFNEEESDDDGSGKESDRGEGQAEDVSFYTDPSTLETKKMTEEEQEKAEAEAEELAKSIAEKLIEELAKGQLEIETAGRIVIVRIKEKGSFSSGSDRIKPVFRPVIKKIGGILEQTLGRYYVVGHTDNIPMLDHERFRSNWDLSSARAVSVLHELLKNKKLKPENFEVSGVAATQPLDDNKTAAGRSKNRRVEIRILQGNVDTGSTLSTEKKAEKQP